MMELILCLLVIQTVTSETVVSRPNFGLAYTPVGQLQFVTDKWLHIFRIELPHLPFQGTLRALTCDHHIRTWESPSGYDPRCVNRAKHAQNLGQECNAHQYRDYSKCLAQQAYTKVMHRLYKHFKDDYDHLLDRIEVTFSNFAQRPKRAWLDISGIFSKVFGFGRQKDISSMNKAVQTLEKQFKDQTLAQQTVFKDMTSALDLTRTRLGHLSDRVNRIANYTQKYIKAMLDRHADYLEFSSTRFKEIFTLSLELNQIALKVRKFDRGLATLIQGSISPELISFDLAKQVLDEVASHLARERPMDKVAIKSAQEFYQLQDFYIQRQNNTLYLGLHIPIAHQGDRHILYRIDSYPLPLDSTAKQITFIKNPKRFLAESVDRRFYFHPSTEEILSQCTEGHHKVCHYQPPLHDVFRDVSCEYAVFTNSKDISRTTCQYSVSARPIEPKVIPLNSTTYLLLNISEYTLTCKDKSQTKVGCVNCLLILDHSCGCILKYHGITLFPQHSECKNTPTSSKVKYPKNLMVGKLLMDESDLQGIQGDSLDDSPPTLTLPPLKIFETEISKGVATDAQDDLDLQQVLSNLQQDQTSYKNLADKLYHTQIQPITTRLTLYPDYLPWINMALAIISQALVLYLFWRMRILTAAITLQAAHVRAFDLKTNIFTTPPPPPTDWYHPIVVAPAPHTISLLAIIGLLIAAWSLNELIHFGLNRIRWFRNFSAFWPRSAQWDLIFQVAHQARLITIYLGPIPVLLTDYAFVTQNAISRVDIATIIPGFLYKLSVIQAPKALLRRDDIPWKVPFTAYIGGLNARRIKTAMRNPPVRYRVLVGQDGIFRSPPQYAPTEPKQPKKQVKFVVETETVNTYYDQKPLTPDFNDTKRPIQLVVKQSPSQPAHEVALNATSDSPKSAKTDKKSVAPGHQKAKRPTSLFNV